jgi:hypothetical protein
MSFDGRTKSRNSAIASSIAIATLLLAPTAMAQSERPATPPAPLQPAAQSACSPGGIGPRSSETTSGAPLSDQLSASKGVICPPTGVDPASRFRRSAAGGCR